MAISLPVEEPSGRSTGAKGSCGNPPDPLGSRPDDHPDRARLAQELEGERAQLLRPVGRQHGAEQARGERAGEPVRRAGGGGVEAEEALRAGGRDRGALGWPKRCELARAFPWE
jgi:hypothetical protein